MYLKIMINYYQTVMILSNIDSQFPSHLNFPNIPSFGPLFSLIQCLIDDSTEQEIHNLIIYINLLIPGVFILLSILAVMIRKICQTNGAPGYKGYMIYIKRELIGYLCVATLLLNPFLFTDFLSHFNCIELVDLDSYFLAINRNHKCWTDDHDEHAYLAAVGLSVWCAISPLLFWFYSCCSYCKNTLENIEANRDIRMRVGYSLWGYETPRYYWEYIILLRKFAIALFISMIITQDATVQIVSALFTIGIAMTMHVQYKPFITARLNNLELASLGSVFCLLFFRLLYHVGHYDKNDSEATTLYILYLCFISAFIIYWFICLLFLYLATVFENDDYNCCGINGTNKFIQWVKRCFAVNLTIAEHEEAANLIHPNDGRVHPIGE